MDRWSDSRLLRETVRHPEAFDVFYRRHERLVVAYFMRRLGDPELAADLTSETFAAALLAAGRYRATDDSAAAWLLGIGRHRLLRSIRRGQIEAKARHRLQMPALEVTDDVARRFEQIASDDAVDALLAALPLEQSRAIRAHVIDERSYAEIAGDLKCSEAVVGKRVSRGLGAVRHLTKEAW